MQDKIIILKNTKNGIVKDTILSVQDTIRLNLENLVKLQRPDGDFVVHTIQEPLSGIEYWGLWIAAILGVLTIGYTLFQLKKLVQNDNELQSQIDELVKLNELTERRLRMTVKPKLWTNGSGYNGTDHTIHIKINNRGERAFYKGFDVLEGEGAFWIQKWNQDIVIEKDKYIQLSGRTSGHPKDSNFKIKINYSDDENYQYQTIIEWNNGKVRFLETIEL
ncbi:hypothetical protein WNY78_02540 [Psychroserpens sp. AS72]|uniref:hypothetical protein n=1 Tax=Psychroserpens sp. AS72 TaxID=3135775 RepID=UPI0031730F86